MTEPTRAIFLSYASQDAEAARRICETLRAAGVEVWFDQSELRGGDAWDQKIRREVHDCALFIPIISTATASRHEGYFRLEWDLADQRTHRMARNKAFIVPVCLDATADAGADVPESFLRVQWTRLAGGTASPAFVDRVSRLLSAEPGLASTQMRLPAVAVSARPKLVPLLIATFLLVGGYFALDKFVLSKRPAASLPGESPASAMSERSIAVLPFVNMSSDKEQDYFSDGLTEEMIELLSQVPDLRVPARTSSFYFKGKSATIANIAQQLKVAYVLEGSVRKAGKHLRITAQLIRAVNGYHLWSQTYDRDDADVFAVQDDIAKAVVSALQVKLETGVQEKGSRGTTNTEAYNQYLLGRQLYGRATLEGLRHAVEAYGKAIALDPNYAAAYAGLAPAEARIADKTGDAGGIERARHDVEKAILLAPDDAIGYATRSYIRSAWLWDWSGAQADIEKALILDPRNSDVQHQYARLLVYLGRLPEAIAAQRKATELDPLSTNAWQNLGRLYIYVGNYAAADAAVARALEIEPESEFALHALGLLRLLQDKPQEAIAMFRRVKDEALRQQGIAMAEHNLKAAKASQQALDELVAKHAQDSSYQIAEVHAWRGDKERAFEWLERAYQQQDGGLSEIKTDPLLKSLVADPRFDALLRKMKLPE